MPDIRLKVETQNLNMALKDMQRRLSGRVAPRRIIEYETGKVLETALARTNRATKKTILKSEKDTIWATYDFGRGNKRVMRSWRLPDKNWAIVQEIRKRRFLKKAAAIGLSKALFLYSIEKLGLAATVPGYVRNATPQHREDVATATAATADGYAIQINFDSPLINKGSNFTQALFSAIVGRRKYFEQSARRGVFNELSEVAKRFPGLIVNS